MEPEEGILGEGSRAALDRFAEAAWGGQGSSTLLQELRPDVQFINLGEFSEVIQNLFGFILQHDKILVRREYRAALQALETDPLYKRGACVIGQPGIGKTYFLVYVIVELMRKKQPVVLQFLNGLPHYALFAEKVTIHSLTSSAMPLSRHPDLWALSDSNGDINSPPGIFKRVGMRIIQTTSPRACRWKEWSKQFSVWKYVMDVWSEDEMVDLANLNGLHVDDVKDLAKKWGGVPRTILKFIENKQVMEVETIKAANRAVEESQSMMDALSRLDLPEDAPSAYYFLRPVKNRAGDINRALSYACVPTHTLRFHLAEALQGKDNSIKLRFFNALSFHPATRQTAGFIYESWFHSFFSKECLIRCQWVTEGIPGLPAELRGTTALVTSTNEGLSSRQPPFYWVPSHRYLPGIDSVLVLEKEIFAIQVIEARNHESLDKGLQQLQLSLPHALKGSDIAWRVLIVGMEEDYNRRVAEEWAGKLFSLMGGIRIPVGWSTVDPIQSGVSYRVFHDE